MAFSNRPVLVTTFHSSTWPELARTASCVPSWLKARSVGLPASDAPDRAVGLSWSATVPVNGSTRSMSFATATAANSWAGSTASSHEFARARASCQATVPVEAR